MTKPNAIQQTITLADGRTITLETGLLAKQAHGSVVVSMGNAKLLATVVSSKTPKEGIDFLPLTLDYRERFPAAGRFPGGYLKREGRPTDNEILVMRLVDRVLRPLFPPHYHHETQIMIQLMSHDPEVASDALAGLAASAALAVSDIPFDGPISEVRVARIDGEFIINPSHIALEKADIDLMVGASIDSVTMVEGEMNEVSEDEMIEAIGVAHEAIKDQINAQIALAKEVGAYDNKREVASVEVPQEITQAVLEFAKDKILDAALNLTQKEERSDRLSAIKEELMATLDEETIAEEGKWYAMAYKSLQKELIRELILDRDYRLDGRKPNEIRPIWSEIDYLPSVHGSAVFTRGETQALATVTLGTSSDANMIDEVSHTGEEYFYLHYNFPPFSTGEARPIRGVSRREIGHGNLAQRALKGAISPDNKYTIRLVSDILESNGSSSMATVCAGSMALMDAGVPMRSAVSGIAMGLVTDPATGRFTVLSDILGDEDFLGDMDFKVTGTDKGITACQMDIKIKGLSYEILSKALAQAKEGRLHILNSIMETIGTSRTDVKAYAPKLETVVVEKEFIGAIIGPGGKVIQDIQAKTGTTITINEVDDKGIVEVLGTSREGMDQALARIDAITFVPQVGDVYDAKVVSIQEYGAFVEIYPGTQGLLHISEIAWERVKNVEDVMKEGDTIKVKFTGLDPKSKKIRLSAKALMPRPEGFESRPRRDAPRNDK